MKPLPPSYYEYHWDPVLRKNVVVDRPPPAPPLFRWLIITLIACILTGAGLVGWVYLSYP